MRAATMVSLALFAAAACTADVPPSPTPEPVHLVLRTAPPEGPLPSGVHRMCPGAEAHPVRLAREDGTAIFVAVDDGRVVPLVWPHGTTAQVIDGRVVLMWSNGTVVAREADVLDGLGGGVFGDEFFVCSVN